MLPLSQQLNTPNPNAQLVTTPNTSTSSAAPQNVPHNVPPLPPVWKGGAHEAYYAKLTHLLKSRGLGHLKSRKDWPADILLEVRMATNSSISKKIYICMFEGRGRKGEGEMEGERRERERERE
tara:strand:+ start:247 stop:615 length:369 start_codon:yes stop_codon:yes gene_type:complete